MRAAFGNKEIKEIREIKDKQNTKFPKLLIFLKLSDRVSRTA